MEKTKSFIVEVWQPAGGLSPPYCVAYLQGTNPVKSGVQGKAARREDDLIASEPVTLSERDLVEHKDAWGHARALLHQHLSKRP